MYVYRYIYTNTYISEHRLVGLVKRLAWSLLNGWRSWTAVHYKYIHIINTRICTHTYANVYVSEHGLVGLVKRLAWRLFYGWRPWPSVHRGRPPVPLAEQCHDGRDKEDAHDEGVGDDGEHDHK